MVAATAVATAVATAFLAAGPLGLLIGLPLMLFGLGFGIPLAAVIGAPVWFGIWRVGTRLRWRSDTIAVTAAMTIGFIWIGVAAFAERHMLHNQMTGPNEPIHAHGMVEIVFAALFRSSYIALLVAPFVAMRFYGGERD